MTRTFRQPYREEDHVTRLYRSLKFSMIDHYICSDCGFEYRHDKVTPCPECRSNRTAVLSVFEDILKQQHGENWREVIFPNRYKNKSPNAFPATETAR